MNGDLSGVIVRATARIDVRGSNLYRTDGSIWYIRKKIRNTYTLLVRIQDYEVMILQQLPDEKQGRDTCHQWHDQQRYRTIYSF